MRSLSGGSTMSAAVNPNVGNDNTVHGRSVSVTSIMSDAGPVRGKVHFPGSSPPQASQFLQQLSVESLNITPVSKAGKGRSFGQKEFILPTLQKRWQ